MRRPNVLLVGPNNLTSCSEDRVYEVPSSCRASADILSAIEDLRPSAIVVVGVSEPDPMGWISRLRWARQVTPSVAIVGSENELPPSLHSEKRPAKEIVSRFRDLLEAGAPLTSDSPRVLFIDQRAREVAVASKKMSCSPAEFRLLVFFLRYPNVVFSRGELLRRTWGSEQTVDSRIVDVLVRRIRMKIENNVHAPTLLRTVRGLGYTFGSNEDMVFDRITGEEFISWPSPDRL